MNGFFYPVPIPFMYPVFFPTLVLTFIQVYTSHYEEFLPLFSLFRYSYFWVPYSVQSNSGLLLRLSLYVFFDTPQSLPFLDRTNPFVFMEVHLLQTLFGPYFCPTVVRFLFFTLTLIQTQRTLRDTWTRCPIADGTLSRKRLNLTEDPLSSPRYELYRVAIVTIVSLGELVFGV